MPARPIPPDMVPWALAALDEAAAETTLDTVAGDASSRRYFRLRLATGCWILVDAPPATEKNAEFLQVRALLEASGVRVPALVAADLDRGFLLLEDLGDALLLPALDADTVDGWYRQACAILRQLAAVPIDSAQLASYDQALLSEELGRFPEWFVGGLLGYSLAPAEQALIDRLGQVLVDAALEQPRVLVHRDFHSRNLMRLADGGLGVIDFQDAVIGPVSYDLVSLLRDCYIRWPAARVERWALAYYRELLDAGQLANSSEADFLRWFDWMGLQRHIKVLGTFARLYLRDGKPGYLDDLPLVIAYVQEILDKYAGQSTEFSDFADWFSQTIAPRIAMQPWSSAR